MQACNWVDMDNDGVLDVFGCHDDALSRMWRGGEDGTLVPAPEFIDLIDYDYSEYPDTDHSGNYGTVWTGFDSDVDIDLFIAKCRQFVNDPNDPRRINQLWVNDGTAGGPKRPGTDWLYEQSWTTDSRTSTTTETSIVWPPTKLHIKFLENDGTGYFTDITPRSGLKSQDFSCRPNLTTSTTMAVDLIYTGGDDGFSQQRGRHSQMPNTFPYGDTMHSFASGDVNRDGQLDVASYGDSYVSPDNDNPMFCG